MNVNHLKREMYKNRIAELTGALELALALLIKLEPPDSRAVSDHFVAMAAIHAGGDIVNDAARQIVKDMLEKIRHDEKLAEDINLCGEHYEVVNLTGGYADYRWVHPDGRWWEMRVVLEEPTPRHPLYKEMHFAPTPIPELKVEYF